MTLHQLRVHIIDLTGRFDLVKDTETYANNGIDFFIENAIRLLDRDSGLADINRSVVHKSDNIVGLIRCRSLKSVYALQGDSWVKLDKKQELPANRGEGFPHSYYKGFPREFGINTPGKKSDTIVVMIPKPTEITTFKFDGLFNTTRLKYDSDSNFWTEFDPELVIKATQYKLEDHYRNRAGSMEMYETIQMMLQGIDFNQVVEDQMNADQMNNSW